MSIQKKIQSLFQDFLTKIKTPTDDTVILDGGSFTITKREILISILFTVLMLCLGTYFAGKIDDWTNEKKQKYEQTLVIDDDDGLFQYGLRTDVGDVLCHSSLKAEKAISLGDEKDRLYIRQELERYTMHTETYTTTDGKGHTTVHTRTYWTWDYVNEKVRHSDNIIFAGVAMPYGKIAMPNAGRTKTVSCGYHLRHVYYVIPKDNSGVLYTHINKHTCSKGKWYNAVSAKDEKEAMIKNTRYGIIIFWCIWVAVIIFLAGMFCYMDNNWLD